MNVWLVFTESGEYSQHSKDMEGAFSDETSARKFATEIGGEVEEHPLLENNPVPVTHFRRTDHVAPDGSLSPGGLGRSRDKWPSWKHQGTAACGKLVPWNKSDFYVEVNGYDEDAVKAEHARLVAEARRLMGNCLPVV